MAVDSTQASADSTRASAVPESASEYPADFAVADLTQASADSTRALADSTLALAIADSIDRSDRLMDHPSIEADPASVAASLLMESFATKPTLSQSENS